MKLETSHVTYLLGHPVCCSVLKERGQLMRNRDELPDPIDAQWAARNKTREDFYVPRKSALFPQ